MLQATRGRGSNLTFVIGHIRTHIRILTRMQQPGLQVVSAGELARHSSVDSLWVAVHGLVYDLTGFIDEHPGGKDVLINNAGTDATNFFEYLGHTSRARQMMKKYLIGRLVT